VEKFALVEKLNRVENLQKISPCADK
jgi:hypothetical protein